MSHPRGTFVHLAHEIKKVVNVPVIGVGRINNPFLAEAIVRDGRTDMVCLGRSLFCDPHFMRKYLEGHPVPDPGIARTATRISEDPLSLCRERS